MISEGQRVFNSIYKRTYRSLKEEFRKLYKLNSIYLNEEVEYYSISSGEAKKVLWQDYSEEPRDIVPAADPSMISDQDRVSKATLLKTMAASTPGYDKYLVEKNFLSAMKVSNIDSIYPDPKGPNAIPTPPNPKVVVETMKLEVQKLDIQMKGKLAQAELMMQWEETQAKIEKLRAEATKALAEAQGVETGHQLAAINASIGLLRAKQDGMHKAMTIIQKMSEGDKKDESNTGRVSGVEEQPSNE
jgi:chaperonin GroES